VILVCQESGAIGRYSKDRPLSKARLVDCENSRQSFGDSYLLGYRLCIFVNHLQIVFRIRLQAAWNLRIDLTIVDID
jgi:hypothetical protein